jgi:hypothetical protein
MGRREQQLVTELRELQDHAAAASHLPDLASIQEAMRRSLARAGRDLDPQITKLVERIAAPVNPPSRRRRALLASVLATPADAAGEAAAREAEA